MTKQKHWSLSFVLIFISQVHETKEANFQYDKRDTFELSFYMHMKYIVTIA